MATNIDRAMTPFDVQEAEPIEIEIENPDAVTIGMGDV